ncbi:HEPN domain-containing protein [Virgibacillus natechei]|uniref:HEPN domain-containing protein n=1 Tax=Virgibacillus natechei TaxID=1216297 RepID=A0ABS4IME5_9BACI|nr:HEPN domain-containing protein [Virgibacillus natechei]MBP1971735.1 HEPN domain-containing protein [Virgibacillus natechei]UZD12341.1 HEPN domain-containing protein [Virgibacillus natechei]
MNRKELKEIAEIRLKEAKVLLENKCYDGTYYLSGYVIECVLKLGLQRIQENMISRIKK